MVRHCIVVRIATESTLPTGQVERHPSGYFDCHGLVFASRRVAVEDKDKSVSKAPGVFAAGLRASAAEIDLGSERHWVCAPTLDRSRREVGSFGARNRPGVHYWPRTSRGTAATDGSSFWLPLSLGSLTLHWYFRQAVNRTRETHQRRTVKDEINADNHAKKERAR